MSLSGIVLVTGGAGFIGSHIAEAAAGAGARVRVLDDLTTGYAENLEEIGGEVDFVRASVNDREAVRRALEGVELVFHEAAIPSVPSSVENPEETHRACAEGTFTLLVPKTEEMAPMPLSPYAAAKLVGEHYCQAWAHSYGFETVCLRYFNIFGPRQDPGSQYSGVISRFVSALATGERPVIYGDGEQSRDFTYVANAVDANLRAAESAAAVGQIINVANGERTTLNELLAALKTIMGRTEVEAEYREPRVGDVRHSLADITRARDLLGYEPRVKLEEGLRLTIDWWERSRFAGR